MNIKSKTPDDYPALYAELVAIELELKTVKEKLANSPNAEINDMALLAEAAIQLLGKIISKVYEQVDPFTGKEQKES